MPISWKGTLQQYVGRLHRLHDAKRVVRVYDYVDSNVLMLARMYARRLKGLQCHRLPDLQYYLSGVWNGTANDRPEGEEAECRDSRRARRNMTQKQSKPVVVHMDIRKLEPEPETNLPSLTKAKLEALIEESVVDAYGDNEQKVGLLTMMQEHLALPFSVSILGIEATVEKVDMTRDGRIVAVCQRNGIRQRIEFLDLPLPKPAPAGAEWIAAYCHWRRGF
jgi:hypothetical protein